MLFLSDEESLITAKPGIIMVFLLDDHSETGTFDYLIGLWYLLRFRAVTYLKC